ncbi:MAG: phosphatidylglycerol lysyltransferase domain-containing protein [Prevotellaceae bacterium]|nr:phosphatidylglycerol lysyltransferase domain-containing protein [Prevotellaceae bacterium]
MINFRPLTLEDRDLVRKYTYKSQRRNCDLSFSNLYSWRFLYDTEIAEQEDYLFFRFKYEGETNYMFPVGNGSVCRAIFLLREDAKSRNEPLRMMGVCSYVQDIVKNGCPANFQFSLDRDRSDYIYLHTDLATLSGKKFQQKRNHINKFKATYPNHKYQPLTPHLIEECLALQEKWFQANEGEKDESMTSEYQSVRNALTHFEELELSGGVLYVDNELVAFTFGNPINEETFDICVEKADREIQGAYAMINNEFAKQIPEKYIYINREEDLGIEGLRKAKLSYNPILLLEKYSVLLEYDR